VVADLRFPVLAVSESSIIVYRDPEHLCTCGEEALTNGYLSRLQLVDSELLNYAVLKAIKIGYVGIFRGWHPFYASRRVRVALTLGPARQLTLASVQQSVIDAMNKNPDFWESAGDLAEQAAEIRATESFADLLQRFA